MESIVFFSLLKQYHIGLNWIGNVKIAVVGHKTENALAKWINYEADFIPTVYDADTMAAEFLQEYPIADNLLLSSRKSFTRCITESASQKLTKHLLHLKCMKHI